jgi:hypothetical protein
LLRTVRFDFGSEPEEERFLEEDFLLALFLVVGMFLFELSSYSLERRSV